MSIPYYFVLWSSIYSAWPRSGRRYAIIVKLYLPSMITVSIDFVLIYIMFKVKYSFKILFEVIVVFTLGNKNRCICCQVMGHVTSSVSWGRGCNLSHCSQWSAGRSGSSYWIHRPLIFGLLNTYHPLFPTFYICFINCYKPTCIA